MNYQVHHMPQFFYGGHNGVPSDKPFIEKHISRLIKPLQKVAADQYDHLYLYYINQKEFQIARELANQYLEQYANQNGGPVRELKELNVSDENKDKVKAMVERAKQARKENRPTIIPRGH